MMRFLLILLLPLLITGCDFFELDGDKMRCYSDEECEEGWNCNLQSKRCVAAENPCFEITCGGEQYGVCNVENSLAVCSCKEGYQDSDSNLVCEAACPETLPEYTVCDHSSGKAITQCAEGYQDKDKNKTCLPNCATTCDLTLQNCDDSSGEAICSIPAYFFKSESGSSVVGKLITKNPDNGNLYIAGAITGTVDFDPSEQSQDLKTASSSSIFISQLDKNLAYQWTLLFEAQKIPQSAFSPEITLNAIASDSEGNILLTGSFKGFIDVNPDSDIDQYLTADSGVSNLFLIKLSPNGDYLNAFSLGETVETIGDSVIVDSSDNIYIGGRYLGAYREDASQNKIKIDVDLDPTTGTDFHYSTDQENYDAAFIIKLNKDHAFQWSFQISSAFPKSYPSTFPATPEKTGALMPNNPRSIKLSTYENNIFSITHYQPADHGQINYYDSYGKPVDNTRNLYHLGQVTSTGSGRVNWALAGGESDLSANLTPMPNGKIYLGASFKGENINFNFLSSYHPMFGYPLLESSSVISETGDQKTYSYDLFIAVFNVNGFSLEGIYFLKSKGDYLVNNYYISSDYQIYIYGMFANEVTFDHQTSIFSKDFTRDIFLLSLDLSTPEIIDESDPKRQRFQVNYVKTLSGPVDLTAGDLLPYNDSTFLITGSGKSFLGKGFDQKNDPYISTGESDTILLQTDLKINSEE